jgi:hypothetical protein
VNPVVEAASKRRLRKAVNIADLREAARLRSHKMVFDYLDSGSDDEIALRRAKDAYSEWDLHYHVLSGLQPPLDLSTQIFGRDVKLPFFTCPCAGNRMFHTEGEKAVALAAQKHGTLYGLSTLATTSVQEVGELNDGPKVFQLYVWKDRALLKDMLDMAKEQNYDGKKQLGGRRCTWFANGFKRMVQVVSLRGVVQVVASGASGAVSSGGVGRGGKLSRGGGGGGFIPAFPDSLLPPSTRALPAFNPPPPAHMPPSMPPRAPACPRHTAHIISHHTNQTAQPWPSPSISHGTAIGSATLAMGLPSHPRTAFNKW